eukprot:249311_1
MNRNKKDIIFRHNDTINIVNYQKYQIQIKNNKILGEQYIVLQQINVYKQFEQTNKFIDNLFIKNNKSISLQSIELVSIALAHHISYDHISNYKFSVQKDDEKHTDQGFIFQTPIYHFITPKEFDIPLMDPNGINYLFVKPLNETFQYKKIKSFGDNPIFVDENDDSKLYDNQIELSTFEHNGHSDNSDRYHPKNLLDDSDWLSYMSQTGSTSGDWLIFKMHLKNKVKPKILRIRNDTYPPAIRSISLYVSSSSDYPVLKWNKIGQDIKNISRTNKKEQEFVVCFPDQKSKEVPVDLLKLEISENYGAENNCFYSFSLFS